mgnify:CR=1 FL=1
MGVASLTESERRKLTFNELCAGHVSDASRKRVIEIIQKAKDTGADSVILGCTEIGLLIKPEHSDLPLLDTTELHAQSAVAFALGD